MHGPPVPPYGPPPPPPPPPGPPSGPPYRSPGTPPMPPHGQPPHGAPPSGQPPYGQPPGPPPGQPYGHAPPPADGDPAGPGRRLAAWGVDYGLVLAVAALLGTVTFQRISASLSNVTEQGVWNLLGSGGDVKDAAADTGWSLWRSAVNAVWQGFAALVAIQFLYQFVAVGWRGRTLGKLLLGVRVRRAEATAAAGGPGRGRAARRAAVTTVTDTGLYALACCLLVQGWFFPSVVCWLLAVAAFWGNALPILGPRHRTLGDRLAGTEVVLHRLTRAAMETAARGGRAAVGTAAHGGRAAVGGAAQGGRLAVEGARNAAGHERVRRAGEAGRKAGRGAAERGLDLWTRSRRRWADRRGDPVPPGGQAPPALPPPPPHVPGMSGLPQRHPQERAPEPRPPERAPAPRPQEGASEPRPQEGPQPPRPLPKWAPPP